MQSTKSLSLIWKWESSPDIPFNLFFMFKTRQYLCRVFFISATLSICKKTPYILSYIVFRLVNISIGNYKKLTQGATFEKIKFDINRKELKMDKYDVIIIGAGPVGFSCGIEAIKRGYNYLMLEKGCLVNSIFHFPTNMTFFSTSERLEIGDVPFISHGYKPTRREALEYYRRVKEKWQLNVKVWEKVTAVNGQLGDYTVQTNKATYQAKSVIVATGFFDTPNLLNVPGEDLPKVKHYFDEPHPYAFQKVIVVGAGNSAVDVALETYRRSAEVTMVIRESALKDSIKYWVKPDIENRIAEGGIKAFFNSTIEAIRPTEVDILTPQGRVTLENDYVLAMTGYRPNYSFLEKIGIEIANDDVKTPVYNEDTFESNRPGIFLAGVVCGGLNTSRWFIENAHDHSTRIFNRMDRLGIKSVSPILA
jgi:thioredoxin reductase (NADPH)